MSQSTIERVQSAIRKDGGWVSHHALAAELELGARVVLAACDELVTGGSVVRAFGEDLYRHRTEAELRELAAYLEWRAGLPECPPHDDGCPRTPDCPLVGCAACEWLAGAPL